MRAWRKRRWDGSALLTVFVARLGLIAVLALAGWSIFAGDALPVLVSVYLFVGVIVAMILSLRRPRLGFVVAAVVCVSTVIAAHATPREVYFSLIDLVLISYSFYAVMGAIQYSRYDRIQGEERMR